MYLTFPHSYCDHLCGAFYTSSILRIAVVLTHTHSRDPRDPLRNISHYAFLEGNTVISGAHAYTHTHLIRKAIPPVLAYEWLLLLDPETLFESTNWQSNDAFILPACALTAAEKCCLVFSGRGCWISSYPVDTML